MRLLLTLVIILFLAGCVFEEKIGECSKDSDCAAGGCSGQICASKEKAKEIITTCEWREIYSCYKLTSCSCINNKCEWKSTPDFDECLEKYK